VAHLVSTRLRRVAAIRANTVLPADRHPVTLHTADGLSLVGELALPPDGRSACGTLICVHPLPTHGGSMDSHLFRKAAWRLPALADLAVLRFNTRGTGSDEGRSEGAFDEAQGERYDVAAALDLAESADLAVGVELPPPWLIGWSFGSDLVLKHGRDPSIEGAVLISPPLRFSTDDDLDAWAATGKPLTLLVPEFDDYLRPDEARRRFSRIPSAEVVAVEGAKHLFVGYTERVLDEIVCRVLPGAAPLPKDYPADPIDEGETA
jgi:alpha/beta superfamily hydrolase